MLPKITEEGFVEYGLIIPHSYYSHNAVAIRGRRSKLRGFVEGPDVAWILKGSGGISKGTTGQFLGLMGGNGQFGSNVSLQSIRSNNSSAQSTYRDRRSNSIDNETGNGRGSADSGFNNKQKVPEIKRNERRSRSESPPNRGRGNRKGGRSRSNSRSKSRDRNARNRSNSRNGRNRSKSNDRNGRNRSNSRNGRNRSKSNDRNGRNRSKSNDRNGRNRSTSNDRNNNEDNRTEEQKKQDELERLEDIKNHWKNDDRGITSAEKKKREETYDTFTVSQSQLDLRAMAATPPALRRKRMKDKAFAVLKEEDEEEEGGGNGRRKGE